MSNTELKPCPFCGGEAELVEKFVRRGFLLSHRYVIKCNRCGKEDREYFYRFEAVEAWNRRVE